jgi:hypothetical protein
VLIIINELNRNKFFIINYGISYIYYTNFSRIHQIFLSKHLQMDGDTWRISSAEWFHFEVKWSEVSYGEVLVDKGAVYLRVTLYCGYFVALCLFHLSISCTVFVLICTVVVLNCFVMCRCVCVCVCVGFVMCWCFRNVYTRSFPFGYTDWLFSVLFS